MPRAADPRGVAPALAAALAAGWVLTGLRVPLVEDSLFWWVPQALLQVEQGLSIETGGPLPAALQAGLEPGAVPRQWTGGLPDYAHPPLWTWWLAAFLAVAPRVEAVHLAAALPAALAAAGFASLGQRLGHRYAGFAIFGLPPVLSLWWRAELDLPLLAVVPWALLALIDGRWGRFAVLSVLAVGCKEPGVLLAAPAAWRCLHERRLRPQALAPLLALGAWGLLHPAGLASPERLPASVDAWLRTDLPAALRLAFWDQGRGLLLLGLPFVLRHVRGMPGQLCVVFAVTWVVFFSAVGFFATGGPSPLPTHVRYFVPGLAVAAVVLGARWPALALPGLLSLLQPSPWGPEASLHGLAAARAEAESAPWIARRIDEGQAVWVGSYHAAALTQPWAGAVPAPVRGLRVYGPETDPAALAPGDLLVIAAYGEPAGRLLRALSTDPVASWSEARATARAVRVRGPAPR